MSDHRKTAIKALEAAKGDDLYRAKARFNGMTGKQLATEYGESGRTCAEILKGYEEREAEINAAIEWVKAK